MPVVTNMEDMWKVSKLQRERERKADAAAKAQARKEAVEAATKATQGAGSHADSKPTDGGAPLCRSTTSVS